MTAANYEQLPADLPVPRDDGAAAHLPGMTVPAVTLPATAGAAVNLASAGRPRVVVYVYPMTGTPGVPLIEGWDQIPGARGCTPESMGFRDHYQELTGLGAEIFGLSSQDPAEQAEAAARLALPFPLLSDSSLVLAERLRLPTFTAGGAVRYQRLTLMLSQGRIEHVFYPVFPPDRHAAEVTAWLRERAAAVPAASQVYPQPGGGNPPNLPGQPTENQRLSTGVSGSRGGPTHLIDVATLACELAGDSPPALLDVRWRLGGPPGIDSYRAGHLPGAVFADLDTDLAAPPGKQGRHPLPALTQFQAAMRRAGVRAGHAVVAYDDGDSTIAARAWWLLRYFGANEHLPAAEPGRRAGRRPGRPASAAGLVRGPTPHFRSRLGRRPDAVFRACRRASETRASETRDRIRHASRKETPCTPPCTPR